MKLISLNIQNNLHGEEVLKFLKKENAEVICLQECLEENFDFFKKELDFEGVFKTLSYVDSATYPDLKDKRQGIAIFTKKILDSGYIFYAGSEENTPRPFVEYKLGEKFNANRALIWVKTEDSNGLPYTFITTHLPDTCRGVTTPYQLEVADAFLKKLEAFKEFVLCGDMNARRGEEAFGKIAEKYKDNIPSEYKTSLDQNLHRVKGLQNMVDGLFTTPTYKAYDVKLVDGLSDHMAIIALVDKK